MTHAEYASRSYLPELDGLRALSILIVISVHTKDTVWGWLSGSLGVTVFFVLSGYLITMLALREERSRGALNLGAFFVRRAFRLLPLYYLVLGVYCILIFGLRWVPEKREMLAGALPYYLTYFQEYPFFVGVHGSYANIPYYQTWSLGIEEKFYLIWPFVGFVAWRRAGGIRLLGTASLSILMMLAPAILGPMIGRFVFPYSHILVGCVVALLLDDQAWFGRLRWLGRPSAAWIVLGTFFTLHFAYPSIPRGSRSIAHCGYTFVTAIFLMTLLIGEGTAQRFLRIPALVLIGKLSYGMYLIHLFALNGADKMVRPGSGHMWQSFASYILACILSVAVAYTLNMIVERPCIAMGKRISARLQREVA